MPVTVVDGDLPPGIAHSLRAAGRVAVDTETSGLDWLTDRLHLCQIHAPATGPVLLRNIDGVPMELSNLLGDPTVVKVFHYAPFDLRFLESKWGVRTRSVECTKAASRLLDPDLPASQHSLQALLDRHLGIVVAKGAVRISDWGASTLSNEQIAYAVADVDHLLDLSDVLGKRLEAKGLAELFTQVCSYMPVDTHLAVSGVPNPLAY